ncbi:uncharacterized protein LOC125012398 isoform X2 [Mugil cephalus]|uniref:uncharacterized protein LOC125012398 isoform X2 n=1 Tax=Mugil cephalus TaxID=48193 RepID=UPI001FB576E0|nr:uncharacterized protein LOC125012398 isoform X2 [Mugil cephalus]
MNFTLITAFSLCSLCWFSVSGSEVQTMDVKSGQDVTLKCSNVDQYDTVITWFRVVDQTSDGFICTMDPNGKVKTTSDRFTKEKYETSSNSSSVSLTIKSVDSSDSGLYVCGIIRAGNLLLSRTHLKIDGTDESDGNMDSKCKQSDEMVQLVSVALRGLTVVLVMVIIGLVVRSLKKLKKNGIQSKVRNMALTT